MRCVVRIIILTLVVFVFFIYLIVSYSLKSTTLLYDDNDIAARRILENAIPSQTNPSENSNAVTRQSMSVSVALVLIVSLVSVALLITGIIIIAVTLDPTSQNSDEDFLEEESDLEIDDLCPDSPKYYPPSFLSEL